MAREIITGIILNGSELAWASIHDDKKDFLSGALQVDGSDATDRIKAELGGGKGLFSVGLPTEQVLLKVLELPVLDDESEIAGMIELQVDKISPFPIETMIVGHEIIEMRDNLNLVLVAAVKKDVVNSIGAVLHEAGIKVGHVDISILSWLTLLRDAGELEEEGLKVVIIFDGDVPDMLVLEDGIPVALRSLSSRKGLDEETFADDLAMDVGHTLMSLDFKQGLAESVAVFLWYRGENPSVIANRLAEEEFLSKPIIKQLDALPPVAVGVARRQLLPENKIVDLLPDEWKLREIGRKFKKKMYIIVGSVVSLWILLIVGFFGGLYFQGMRNNMLKNEVAQWKTPYDDVAAVRRRVHMIDMYSDSGHSALKCLKEVSRMLPDNSIIIKTFDYKKGSLLKLTGDAASSGVILKYADLLTKSGLFDDVKMGAQGFNSKTRRTTFSFDLALPGGKE